MNDASGPNSAPLISNSKEAYGDRFQEHLLEQYKLYVESSQKVSEKRITTGNYLLTVNSSLLTVFGIAATQHLTSAWLAIIPIAGLLVSLTWYSLVISYKDLNTAKFKVIHELETWLPAALFRYEWDACEHGKGTLYTPITHLERWIPVMFACVYLTLTGYALFFRPPASKPEPQAVTVSGTMDVNMKEAVPTQIQTQQTRTNPTAAANNRQTGKRK